MILKDKPDYTSSRKVKEGYKVTITPYVVHHLSLLDKKELWDYSRTKFIDIDSSPYSNKNWKKGLNKWREQLLVKSPILKVNDNLTLSSYQTKGLELMFSLERALLLMEQGTGKTPIALSCLNYRKRENLSYLIACPNNAKQEWVSMIEEFFPELKYIVVDDNKDFTVFENTIYIMGYDRLIRIPKELSWDMLIFDEVHKLKSVSSKRHKTSYELSLKAKYVYGLTGTPYGNKIEDVFGICKVVDERLYGPNLYNFQDKYMVIKKQQTRSGDYFPLIIGYKNMEEFKSKLQSISYRVELNDVVELKGSRELRLWNKKSEEYDKMKLNYILNLDNDVSVVQRNINLTMKLQQLCSGYTHGEKDWYILNRNKLESLLEYCKDNDEQAIIFLTYDLSEKMITEEFNKLGYSYSTVSKFSKDPELSKKMFKENKVQYIIIKFSSGSEGMNFQNARNMIFYDIPLSYTEYSQAKSRIYRRGQEHECLYIYMLTEDSVEKKILNNLKQHKDFSTYILEGGEI
jgi:SNF2 family DNA or RNA helicase